MKYKNGNSDDTGKAEKERIIEVRISEQWNLCKKKEHGKICVNIHNILNYQ